MPPESNHCHRDEDGDKVEELERDGPAANTPEILSQGEPIGQRPPKPHYQEVPNEGTNLAWRKRLVDEVTANCLDNEQEISQGEVAAEGKKPEEPTPILSP